MHATLNGVASSGAPVLVTHHNKPKVVVVSLDHFQDMYDRANFSGNAWRSAWRCPSCHRFVDLGEEGMALTSEPEALCGACGTPLVANSAEAP